MTKSSAFGAGLLISSISFRATISSLLSPIYRSSSIYHFLHGYFDDQSLPATLKEVEMANRSYDRDYDRDRSRHYEDDERQGRGSERRGYEAERGQYGQEYGQGSYNEHGSNRIYENRNYSNRGYEGGSEQSQGYGYGRGNYEREDYRGGYGESGGMNYGREGGYGSQGGYGNQGSYRDSQSGQYGGGQYSSSRGDYGRQDYSRGYSGGSRGDFGSNYGSIGDYGQSQSYRSDSGYDQNYGSGYRSGDQQNYGSRSNQSFDRYSGRSDYGRGDDRGFFERAGDEVRSWFGDEEAERRRRQDARESGYGMYYGQGYSQDYSRGYGSAYSGRGPKNYSRSDERIAEDINERLMRHYEIDASDIEVHVRNGEVTLTGTVDNRRMKHLVEDIADDIAGVKDVNNQLRVNRGSTMSSNANNWGTSGHTTETGTTPGMTSGTSSAGSTPGMLGSSSSTSDTNQASRSKSSSSS
jgi:osmotically-inducible protein OsmY